MVYECSSGVNTTILFVLIMNYRLFHIYNYVRTTIENLLLYKSYLLHIHDGIYITINFGMLLNDLIINGNCTIATNDPFVRMLPPTGKCRNTTFIVAGIL